MADETTSASRNGGWPLACNLLQMVREIGRDEPGERCAPRDNGVRGCQDNRHVQACHESGSR